MVTKANKAHNISPEMQILNRSKIQSKEGQQPHRSRQAPAKDSSYAVDLSPTALRKEKEQQQAFKIAKETPSIDQSKIARIKDQIKNGTYKVDSGKIADGILKEAIKEHLSISS